MTEDHIFMSRALALAENGRYTTTPNPCVGCVIVDTQAHIIGEGWTQPAGEDHAEVQALKDAAKKGHSVAGATLYVTLEPCSHFGRTPPCADALIHAGVARVVVAMQDPNPLVAGRGLNILRQRGIKVEVGLMEHEARLLNQGFIHRMSQGRPLVRLKIAATLDGKIALNNGQSQWITGELARADGHHWRARSCAILTGIGTVIKDDPQLNVRAVKTSRQPLKIIVDTHLATPPGATLLKSGQTLIATCCDDAARGAKLQECGAEVLQLPAREGQVDLMALMLELGRRGINEVLTEAGPRLNGGLISAGCADALLLYLAPSLMGEAARSMLQLAELGALSQMPALRFDDFKLVGDDLRILASLRKNELGVQQTRPSSS